MSGWFRTGRVSKENLVAFARIVGRRVEDLVGQRVSRENDTLVQAEGSMSTEEAAARGFTKPTRAGERIITFLTANNVLDRREFAEGVLGVTVDELNRWIYTPDAEPPLRPLLRMADVLSTNAEYLLGESDDPRPGMVLDFREFQLVQAFRELSPAQQDLLLKTASAWHQETGGTAAAPFRVTPPGEGTSH